MDVEGWVKEVSWWAECTNMINNAGRTLRLD